MHLTSTRAFESDADYYDGNSADTYGGIEVQSYNPTSRFFNLEAAEPTAK
jgi:hypothetical protein